VVDIFGQDTAEWLLMPDEPEIESLFKRMSGHRTEAFGKPSA